MKTSMREIKFRALVPVNTDEPKMMMYYDISRIDDLNRLAAEDWDINQLMQYTGLRDKNGKEIYEGDIVKWDDGSNGEYWRVAVVYWDEEECLFCFKCVKNKLYKLSTKDGYVFGANFSNRTKHQASRELIQVGNIYENPELL